MIPNRHSDETLLLSDDVQIFWDESAGIQKNGRLGMS
jgi:hypothetical protein